ncbi:MAG: hypothetical protein WDM96_04265 [Lacunisphaera sp.]
MLALLAAGRPVAGARAHRSALAARLADLGQPCVLLAAAIPVATEIAAVAGRLRDVHRGDARRETPSAAPDAAAMAAKTARAAGRGGR